MESVWGVILMLVGGVAWFGQLICAFSPTLGVKWGLTEGQKDTDRALFIEGQGEAIWDALTIWTLPLCGILLLLEHPYWPYVGLIGGGGYLYFSGRAIATRIVLKKNKISIGNAKSIKLAYVFGVLWALTALITIAMAWQALALFTP